MKLAHLHFPGLTSFTRVSNLQQTLTTRLLAHKKLQPGDTTPPPDPTIITFTPHPVYTTGRRDLPPSNTCPTTGALSLPPSLEPIRPLLTSPSPWPSSPSLSNTHTTPNNESHHERAEYHPTLRGGQTTYHGPGQLVAYTILDLKRLGLTPRCHIRLLENSVLDVLQSFNIKGLITDDPGVWVSPSPRGEKGSESESGGAPRKITAVGVHLRRNISSYGIGFNVTDEPMWYFRQIVACGLEGREATSLQALGVTGTSVRAVGEMFVDAFVRRVNADFACEAGPRQGERIEGVYEVGEGELLGSGDGGR